MTRKLATLALLFAIACATSRRPAARPPESVVVADPRHGIPATSPELESDASERRFGWAEAKARKEAALRAERAQHERLGVVSTVSSKPAARPATPPPKPAGDTACPCAEPHTSGAHAP